MKLKLILLGLAFVLAGCSVNEPPHIEDLNGNWKIYVGSQYSLQTKDISIILKDPQILYDSVSLDSLVISKNNLKAMKKYSKDSIFKLDLTLTFEKDKIWGYEILDVYGVRKQTYIYGERILKPVKKN